MRLSGTQASRGYRSFAVIALCVALSASAMADDFRIVSEIYYGEETEPHSTNRTLFRAGVVYDYLEQPGLTTVFDPTRNRFLLLDPETKLRCVVDTQQVAQFNNALRQRAADHVDPLLKFMAQPEFTLDPAPPQGKLVMTSPLMSYRLKTTRVESPAALRQYIEFSDWYAQLNTMVNPGSPPPFARIEVNRQLRARQEIPLEVHLTISVRQPRGGNREVALHSRHEVVWRLLGEDKQAIEQTADEMATFKQVTFKDFQARGNALAGAPPAPEGEAAPEPKTAGARNAVRKASAAEPVRKPAPPKRK
jgi:hypothetical protein